MTLLEAILKLHATYKWNVIPVKAKLPIAKWKKWQCVKQSQADVRRANSKEVTGFAVIHGKISDNLVIRDFDDKDGYEKWKSQFKKLARSLPTAKTKRGFHVYFRGPSLFKKMADGEYRGTAKQYTLIPPSAHPEGGNYEWVIKPKAKIPQVDDPIKVGLLSEDNETISINDTIGFTSDPTINYSSNYLLNSLRPTCSKTRKVDFTKSEWEKVLSLVSLHCPTREGQRHRKLFDLAQGVKGISADLSTPALARVFKAWWTRARCVVKTKDEALSFSEFIEAYERCLYPGGTMDWRSILDRMADEPLPEEAGCYPDTLQMVVRLCNCLQRLHGSSPFFISHVQAGQLLGVGSETIRLGFRVLERDGLVRLVTKGSNLTKKASTYLYLPLMRE